MILSTTLLLRCSKTIVKNIDLEDDDEVLIYSSGQIFITKPELIMKVNGSVTSDCEKNEKKLHLGNLLLILC